MEWAKSFSQVAIVEPSLPSQFDCWTDASSKLFLLGLIFFVVCLLGWRWKACRPKWWIDADCTTWHSTGWFTTVHSVKRRYSSAFYPFRPRNIKSPGDSFTIQVWILPFFSFFFPPFFYRSNSADSAEQQSANFLLTRHALWIFRPPFWFPLVRDSKVPTIEYFPLVFFFPSDRIRQPQLFQEMDDKRQAI